MIILSYAKVVVLPELLHLEEIKNDTTPANYLNHLQSSSPVRLPHLSAPARLVLSSNTFFQKQKNCRKDAPSCSSHHSVLSSSASSPYDIIFSLYTETHKRDNLFLVSRRLPFYPSIITSFKLENNYDHALLFIINETFHKKRRPCRSLFRKMY